MKTHNLITIILSGLIFIFLFIILMTDSYTAYAACQTNEDIAAERERCMTACKSIRNLFERNDCINVCNGKWLAALDARSECLKKERQQRYLEEQQAEQKRLEEQKLLEQQRALEKQAEQKRLEEEQQAREQEKIVSRAINIVKSVQGKVDLIRDEKISELIPDIKVREGDTIRTGKSGAVKLDSEEGIIQIGGDTTLKFISLKVKPLPPLEPSGISEETEIEKKLELLIGKVRIWLEKFAGRYEVRTPVAVCGIRGTDFIVEHDADTNITTIYLHEGIVDVNNTKGEAFELNAGEMMIVDSSGKTDKSELSEDDWNGLTNSIETGKEFIPSHRKQTIPSGEQKRGMTFYLSLIAVIVLIVFGTFFIKRKRPKEVPRETQLNEYQKRVQALIKKIQVVALIVAAIIVVVGVFSSIDKIKLPKTGPTIGKVPSAYSVTYNMIFPMQQGTWKESVSGNSKKIELETEQVLTSIYILGENYYSCTRLLGQWFCIAISEPTYKPSSDPTIYSKEKPVFTSTKSIADRVANCYAVSVGTICLDKETNILLESRTKTEGGEFVLTAISLNLNPPSQEEFTLPAKPQKTPTITP